MVGYGLHQWAHCAVKVREIRKIDFKVRPIRTTSFKKICKKMNKEPRFEVNKAKI
jgi:hypothetical protein